jgi:hypothetical protein
MKNKTQIEKTNTQLQPKATWPQFDLAIEPTEGLLGEITNFAKELVKSTEGLVSAFFLPQYSYMGKGEIKHELFIAPASMEFYKTCLLMVRGDNQEIEVDLQIIEINKITISTPEKLQLFLTDFARHPYVKVEIEKMMREEKLGRFLRS